LLFLYIGFAILPLTFTTQVVGRLLISLLAAAVPLVIVVPPRFAAVVLVRPGSSTCAVLEVLVVLMTEVNRCAVLEDRLLFLILLIALAERDAVARCAMLASLVLVIYTDI
jgi:hypothetical protein